VPNFDPIRDDPDWSFPFQHLVVHLVPILNGNYAFVLAQGDQAVVVDPGEAAPVLEFLRARHLHLSHIWLTHRHSDHVAGVPELRRATQARVVAPDGLPVPRVDVVVGEGSVVEWGGARFQVWSTPGHQPIHVSYVQDRPQPELAFIGDVLFGAGCGRLFGNPPALLYASHRRLLGLPGACRLFCAHEFTLDNLAFALRMEPGNTALGHRLARVQARRARGLPTVPLILDEERATNPFLRVDQPEIRQRLGLPAAPAVAVFAELRARKDVF
jgi:hydroxyacylglutathione hydrolase